MDDDSAVQFVGAGPGAADLLTIRAARLLAEAEIVLFPGSYLDAGVLTNCSPGAELVDTENLDLDAIVDSVRAYWEAGFTDIALVQIGDENQDLFLKEAAGPLLEKLRAAAR